MDLLGDDRCFEVALWSSGYKDAALRAPAGWTSPGLSQRVTEAAPAEWREARGPDGGRLEVWFSRLWGGCSCFANKQGSAEQMEADPGTTLTPREMWQVSLCAQSPQECPGEQSFLLRGWF